VRNALSSISLLKIGQASRPVTATFNDLTIENSGSALGNIESGSIVTMNRMKCINFSGTNTIFFEVKGSLTLTDSSIQNVTMKAALFTLSSGGRMELRNTLVIQSPSAIILILALSL